MKKNKFKGICTYLIVSVIIISMILVSIYFIAKLCPEQFNIFISSIQSYITSIAILIGGLWAISKSILLRQYAWGINIDTNIAHIYTADEESNWIILNVQINNIGKRRIYLSKLNYSCYEIKTDEQKLLFKSDEDWLSILKNEDEPDLYIEPNESLNRVLYSLVNKNSINLIFKIVFEDNPTKSPYQLFKNNEHIWGSYIFVKNVIDKTEGQIK